jgi:hypothetical protein
VQPDTGISTTTTGSLEQVRSATTCRHTYCTATTGSEEQLYRVTTVYKTGSATGREEELSRSRYKWALNPISVMNDIKLSAIRQPPISD